MKINTKHHVTKNDLLKGNKPNKLHTTIQPNWRPFQIQIWTFQTFIRNIPALCSIAHPIIVPYFPALWTHTALWEHKLSLFQFQRNLVQLNDYRHVSLTYIMMKYLKKQKKTKKELCLYSRKRSILYWLYSNLPTGKGGAHDAANSAICLTIRHLEKPKTFCMSPFR